MSFLIVCASAFVLSWPIRWVLTAARVSVAGQLAVASLWMAVVFGVGQAVTGRSATAAAIVAALVYGFSVLNLVLILGPLSRREAFLVAWCQAAGLSTRSLQQRRLAYVDPRYRPLYREWLAGNPREDPTTFLTTRMTASMPGSSTEPE